MNAYEMADELESLHLFASQERLAAVMLRRLAKEKELLQNQSSELAKEVMYFQEQNRQQADRIAELENEIQNHAMDELVRIGQELENEPYCWHCFWINKEGKVAWEQYEEIDPQITEWDNRPDKVIPLYATPQTKSYRETHEGFSTIIDKATQTKDKE